MSVTTEQTSIVTDTERSLDPTRAVALRRRLAAALRLAGIDETVVAAAELICGELLSNVVRYAPGEVWVSARHGDEGLEVAVEDCGGALNFDDATLPAGTAEGGRGMWIVKSIARTVRVEVTAGGGKRVIAAVGEPSVA